MDKLHQAAAEYAKAADHAKRVDEQANRFLIEFTKRTGLPARDDHMFSDGCLKAYEELEQRAQTTYHNAVAARCRLTEVCLSLYQQ